MTDAYTFEEACEKCRFFDRTGVRVLRVFFKGLADLTTWAKIRDQAQANLENILKGENQCL